MAHSKGAVLSLNLGVLVNRVLLAKSNLADFIAFLAREQKLIAPVALGDGQVKLAEVSGLAQISLHRPPAILPPKKYYLPQHETLLRYDTSQGQRMEALVAVENLILFGLPSCDLAGIQCLDLALSAAPQDEHFLLRKGYLTLIGVECSTLCDPFANCAMLGTDLPRGGYDLFFTELSDYYHIDVDTTVGDALIKRSGLCVALSGAARSEFSTVRLLKKQRFASGDPLHQPSLAALGDQSVDSPLWAELGRRCLACGNCTNACPTCYCFDVLDEPDLNLTTGRRLRVWDSCQNEAFAKVAGGESFRPSRSARQQHRFARKFQYPVARYHRSFCTGCGRCSRHCMAGIDLKETVRTLLAEQGGLCPR